MQRHTDEHCGRFMPTCSCDFYDPAYAPLDMAAEVTGSHTLLSRHIWGRKLEQTGERAFRKTLFLFWADLRAGEEVRSRPRAFSARLNKAIGALRRYARGEVMP